MNDDHLIPGALIVGEPGDATRYALTVAARTGGGWLVAWTDGRALFKVYDLSDDARQIVVEAVAGEGSAVSSTSRAGVAWTLAAAVRAGLLPGADTPAPRLQPVRVGAGRCS